MARPFPRHPPERSEGTSSPRRKRGASSAETSSVEHLLQAVRDQIYPDDERGDGSAREEDGPVVPLVRRVVQEAVVVGDLERPVGRGRLDAEAEEGQNS